MEMENATPNPIFPMKIVAHQKKFIGPRNDSPMKIVFGPLVTIFIGQPFLQRQAMGSGTNFHREIEVPEMACFPMTQVVAFEVWSCSNLGS